MDPRNPLQDSWDRTHSHLERAAQLLGEDAHAVLTEYRAYLGANELELALDELEMVGAERTGHVAYWSHLLEAAREMKLANHQDRYARKLGVHSIPLSHETQRRIEALFKGDSRTIAADLLVTQCGNNLPFYEHANARELERVRFAALKLSGGDLGELRRAIEVAQADWRDVLVAAGFGHDVRAHEAWFPADAV